MYARPEVRQLTLGRQAEQKLLNRCQGNVPREMKTAASQHALRSGNGTADMKDGKPVALSAGAYVQMPAKHIHQFTCRSSCILYLYSDGAFDIHYVDAKGGEIMPDAALTAVKEKVVK